MGTVTPPSFLWQDVVPWLVARHLAIHGGPENGLALGSGSVGLNLGSVSIGRMRWGEQGPTPPHSVQDGFLEVRVDRHGSHVGNPFAGAPVAQLCKAYDELLQAVLSIQLSVDDGLLDYEELRQDSLFGFTRLTAFESELLNKISEKHGVRIHRQRVRPLAVRAWLVYHAKLLVHGQSLCLFC